MSESFVDDTDTKELKKWWNSFGKAAVIGLVLAIVLIIGYRLWNQHVERERVAASQLYDKYQQSLLKHETEASTAAYQTLRNKYAKSPYATAVTLLSAAQLVSQNEYEKAEQELRWVMEQGSDYAKPLARLRAAQINMHTHTFDEALSLLDDPNAGAYKPAFDEMAGDILIQKGDVAAALQRYQTALEQYKAQGFDNILLQYKLQTYAPSTPAGS